MKPCKMDGCGRTDKKMVRGLCGMHYRRWKRGTLDKPRPVGRPRGAVGAPTEWPIDVIKMGDDWFRRPVGSDQEWQPVVWPEREKKLKEPTEGRM